MFENKKDTLLLRGALLSAANANSGALLNCTTLEDSVRIVCNSINKIVYNDLIGTKEEKENIETQLKIHKRLHAALFFVTLRSHGMTFDSLESFYSSIADVWPAVDFKFYIELNFKCNWSEFFIQCASQLPSNILIQVVEIILNLSFSRQVKIYTCHLISQTLTLKVLEIPHDGEIELSFKCHPPVKECEIVKITVKGKDVDVTGKGKDVDVTEKDIDITEKENDVNVTQKRKDIDITKTGKDGDSVKNGEDGDISEKKENIDKAGKMLEEELRLLKETHNTVCDLILDEINKSNDINLIKFLLHEVKTLFKTLLAEKERQLKNISRFGDFMNIYNALDNLLKSNDCQEILKVSMNHSVHLAVKHSYATTSWDISTNYLCLIVSHYWNKMYSDFTFKAVLSARNRIILTDIIMNFSLYKTLNTLNPLYVSGSEIDDEHLNFLCKILQLDFEGASFVAEILLLNPAFIEKKNMVQILRKNFNCIDFLKLYPSILRCVKAVKSQDLKFKLLEMFYKLLSRSNKKNYNGVLVTILTEYGFTEEFQLSDFPEQLSQVFRSTLTIEQAEDIFPMLFVQNPLVLLQSVIDQTLIQGPEGRSYIEPLKCVPFICTYQKNKDTMPTLIGILNNYFEKNLMPVESKNMNTLYKFLMQLQSQRTRIIVLDAFLNHCIIPRLQHDMDKIELILECLCTSITILIQNKTFIIGCKSVISLIISLGKLVNDCILTENARLKASILPVIQALNKHQLESGDIKDEDKEKIFSNFQSFHDVVYVYMKEFIPRNVEFCSESYLWISCCISKDYSQFEKQLSTKTLSHLQLLQILVKILPHLTREEWLHSIELIQICCKNDTLRTEILGAVNKPFHLSDYELNTYAVASCLITCLHFILPKSKNPVFLISFFTNSLMTLLNQEVKNTLLLMTVWFDCCHLAECIPPDLSSLITLMLLDLKKCIITSCSAKNYENDCKKLISFAVKCLTNFSDKMLT